MGANINWIGAALATMSALGLAALWYSPWMFGNTWRLAGPKQARVGQDRSSKIKRFSVSTLAMFASAVIFAAFLGDATFGLATMAGFSAGLFWIALSLGVSYALEPRPFALFVVNSAYHILQFTLYGLCIGAANTYL
ncbi:MAG: DUF1761 domain-containing protein [Pseudomonadota bacterium]